MQEEVSMAVELMLRDLDALYAATEAGVLHGTHVTPRDLDMARQKVDELAHVLNATMREVDSSALRLAYEKWDNLLERMQRKQVAQ